MCIDIIFILTAMTIPKKIEKFLLKDSLFHEGKIIKIALEIKNIFPEFKSENFIQDVVQKFPELELKQRIVHIREMLRKYLPDDISLATKILIESLPIELDPNLKDDDFWNFIYAPYWDFLAHYSLENIDLDVCFLYIKEMTKRFSMEDAIRYFFITFPQETYLQVLEWTQDDNYHVRRLASEGSRPSLPWSKKIPLNYKKSLLILEKLFKDPTRYVTRSVANHMNDISKIDPDLVCGTLKKWQKSDAQDKDYIISHSLRGLIKKGNTDALGLLWYSKNTLVEVNDFNIKNTSVLIGDFLEFSFQIFCPRDEKLMIDYKIYFLGANGKTRWKVFKIAKKSIKSHETITISKKHALKIMTTKKLYPWIHSVALQINGKEFDGFDFELRSA